MDENKILRTLRMQAWERAKGELKAILCTYWYDSNYCEMEKAINSFIEIVEDNSLQS
jgi:hypothetical protein